MRCISPNKAMFFLSTKVNNNSNPRDQFSVQKTELQINKHGSLSTKDIGNH